MQATINSPLSLKALQSYGLGFPTYHNLSQGPLAPLIEKHIQNGDRENTPITISRLRTTKAGFSKANNFAQQLRACIAGVCNGKISQGVRWTKHGENRISCPAISIDMDPEDYKSDGRIIIKTYDIANQKLEQTIHLIAGTDEANPHELVSIQIYNPWAYGVESMLSVDNTNSCSLSFQLDKNTLDRTLSTNASKRLGHVTIEELWLTGAKLLWREPMQEADLNEYRELRDGEMTMKIFYRTNAIQSINLSHQFDTASQDYHPFFKGWMMMLGMFDTANP